MAPGFPMGTDTKTMKGKKHTQVNWRGKISWLKSETVILCPAFKRFSSYLQVYLYVYVCVLSNCSNITVLTLMLSSKDTKELSIYEVFWQIQYAYYFVSARNSAHSEDCIEYLLMKFISYLHSNIIKYVLSLFCK